jgi:hypothetical protein
MILLIWFFMIVNDTSLWYFVQYYIYLKRKMSMKNTCIGCRTYFEEGEQVPLESMVI